MINLPRPIPLKQKDHWVTKEGESILLKDLTDSHLFNIIKLFEKNNERIPTHLLEEDKARHIIRLLNNSPEDKAIWLTSNNPKLRKIAKRCK